MRLHKKARALRVLFEGRRAVGVLYARPDGSRAIARARGAVVLSAGAVQTPQLLMLSGVGPAEALAEHGIALRLHAPAVGGYMQDHIGINYYYKSRVPTLNGVLRSWPGRVRSALDWLLRGRGPFALGVNQGGGFVRSGPDAPRPDLQLYCNPLSYSVTRTGKRVLLEPDPFPGFITSFNPCRPTSRGRIRLASADPLAAPRIEPNALSTDADAAQVLAGVALLRKLGRAPAMRAVVIEPMVADLDAMDDAAALADFRARSGTVYHACGTARMGEDPATSVIDPRLRVHGFDRLYVVDASAFPTVTSGNTNAPTMMLARRAGGFLREDLDKG